MTNIRLLIIILRHVPVFYRSKSGDHVYPKSESSLILVSCGEYQCRAVAALFFMFAARMRMGHSKSVIYWSGHKVPIWPRSIFFSLLQYIIIGNAFSASFFPDPLRKKTRRDYV